MSLDTQLHKLASSGLIRPARTQPEVEYIFRHALVQDAAYASLLRQDRKRLHLMVGDTLESLYAEHLEELAPLLSYHFDAAGDNQRALKYYRLAGEVATRRYANAEAVMHYSHAIDVARQQHRAGLPELYRARGLAYEAVGDFERARADYEAAVDIARRHTDPVAESKALLDLGMLWAGRDYNRTGENYQRAYELARNAGDLLNLAHTLNRIGNWHLNLDQPAQSLEHHQRALAIFEQLNDDHGRAETLDFLGMTSGLSGNVAASMDYYHQAIALFSRLNNRSGMISAIATTALMSPTYQTNTMPTVLTLHEAATRCKEAVALARQSGLRAPLAYSLISVAECLGSSGSYDVALANAQASLELAEQIEHVQWTLYAKCLVGVLHYDMLDPSPAQRFFEEALSLAQRLRSQHWFRAVSGFLASAHIAQGDLHNAKAILDAALPPSTPAQTLGQRVSWCARVELALAQHKPEDALQMTEQLLTAIPNPIPGAIPLRVIKLRGEALSMLGRYDEAHVALAAARDFAMTTGARPMLWRILVSIGRLYQQQGNPEEAANARRAARELATELSSTIRNDQQREQFLECVARETHMGH